MKQPLPVDSAYIPESFFFTALSVFNSKPTLATLPNELLQLIWTHLDEPASFSLINKRFHALSKDTLWRAKWFMKHYAPYEVLFYAIARPAIFKKSLAKQLLRLGAPLSRNLVQLLHFVRDHQAYDGCACDPLSDTKWGVISSPALAVLDRHASGLVSESKQMRV